MNKTEKTRKQTKIGYSIYAAEYTREKMEEMKVLNIYKLSIYQVLTFMFKIKRDSALAAFQNYFREISPWYPKGFSQSNFIEGNMLWNRLLYQKQKKNIAYINGFKTSVKTSFLYLENEIVYI